MIDMSLLFLKDEDELFPMVPSRFVSPRDGTTPDIRAPTPGGWCAVQFTTEPGGKKWYQSKDDSGWDDNIGYGLMTWGSLGVLPGPTDAAAPLIGGAIAKAAGWGARGTAFAIGMVAYGLPLIAIGLGWAMTRLD